MENNSVNNNYLNSIPVTDSNLTTWSCTVETPAIKRKCFSFKSMRDCGTTIFIDKDEWKEFLDYFNIGKSEKPCQ